MSARILGQFKDKAYNASHMACVIDTGEGERHVLMSSESQQGNRDYYKSLMDKGHVKLMVSIPDGCEVTIIGCPDGQDMKHIPSGHHLVMKVIASKALVWNYTNRNWYCEDNVETVIQMVNFEATYV